MYVINKENHGFVLYQLDTSNRLTGDKFYAGTDYEKVKTLVESLEMDKFTPNIEQREDGLYVCWGLHEDRDVCEYEKVIDYNIPLAQAMKETEIEFVWGQPANEIGIRDPEKLLKIKTNMNVNSTETATGIKPKTKKKNVAAPKPAVDPTLPIPTFDRVLVSRIKPETISKGGIIIPDTAIEDETKGYVVAIGPMVGKTERAAVLPGEVNRYPLPGDMIYFGKYAGTELNHNGKTYLMMRESDIQAILP